MINTVTDKQNSTKHAVHILKGSGLSVNIGGTQIIQSINLTAKSGQVVGVLGPSGSGKTTLLYALSGFQRATQGMVTLNSRDLYDNFDELKTKIGFVPQDDIVPVGLKVESVLNYAAQLRLPLLSEEERKHRLNSVMRTLGLRERARVKVKKLSGGERKRVSVAVELLSRPAILFADEPTSGLDPALERELMGTFSKMAKSGTIVLVTTHIMSSLDLIDSVCLLNKGRQVFTGPPSDMKAHFGVNDYGDIYRVLSAKQG